MRRALLLALAFAGTAGCSTSIDIPDGVFACTTVTDCPEDFECRGDGLCYARPDAAVDGAVDGGVDATVDGAVDGGG